MADFDAAGIAVYALSYDEADALRDFRDAHGITYNLLSDPDSEVIRSFGILNTLIDENDHPWYGIPYPGTYVLDSDGLITHKFFDNNLAVRAGPEQMLKAALGKPIQQLPGQPETETKEVIINVAFDGPALAPTVQRDLVVQFNVPTGRHVYANPAPEGSVGVDIVLDENDCLVQRPIVRPTSDPHELAGTGEQFQVHHDVFELRLPLTVNNASRGKEELTVSGTVLWQSCDDEVCDIPSSQRFELTVRLGKSPAVALGSKEGAALEPNAMAHFQKMSERRVTR